MKAMSERAICSVYSKVCDWGVNMSSVDLQHIFILLFIIYFILFTLLCIAQCKSNMLL